MTITVAIDAGKLPAAKRPTIRQFTLPRIPCAATPAILVNEAKIRSVPIAISNGILNRNTRVGVMSEPPPTPVSPTMSPTTRPTAGYKDCRCMVLQKKDPLISGPYPTDDASTINPTARTSPGNNNSNSHPVTETDLVGLTA